MSEVKERRLSKKRKKKGEEKGLPEKKKEKKKREEEKEKKKKKKKKKSECCLWNRNGQPTSETFWARKKGRKKGVSNYFCIKLIEEGGSGEERKRRGNRFSSGTNRPRTHFL